ncbi:hypothetical protein FIU93_22675 [Labrenzia sp. THAF35]|uniref:HK97 gp10 family phage protein n=1 Tax=Labrenzia sp. THAF35 TaxID=2587854 RepID=UPI001268DFE2|nr:HK97 gp10 family phage protein [Labrenzia sp. THAF35]QFT69608.1 hypothetical protein FIU93_22675 [Labrenzia sp. THAF35]
MTAKILGLKRLERKLALMPVVAKKRIREAMAKGADEIVAMMKNLVPVSSSGSHGNSPGTLRDSIDWRWGSKAPEGSVVIATVQGVGAGQDLTLTIYAGSKEAFYAAWVEFGTPSHTAGGKFKGATIPAIPASPFFFVSYRALRKRTKSRITRSINKAAKEVAASG